ncbi:hypothetical protein [Thaumasiovibrio subtropicus]|uniref:hypothetical protein n=1 Tax=Thaumasiovibrio subtropicus TaxID=1891207 RepID=UPI000B34C33E|nr:hypothetical protein [Thaumasiovibrio subtropicus]
MRIAVLRHGRPQLDLDAIKNTRYSARDFGCIVAQYEDSPLALDSFAPKAVMEKAKSFSIIVSSDLLRGIESARQFTVNNIHLVDARFREAGMPYFNLRWPKLTLLQWSIFFRLF